MPLKGIFLLKSVKYIKGFFYDFENYYKIQITAEKIIWIIKINHYKRMVGVKNGLHTTSSKEFVQTIEVH